jgi:DNA topoisomerase-1
MAQWIRREGSKARFRYRHADGRLVRDARTLERIRQLVIPPGWSDVHIAAGARAEIQAWGLDAKQRKQYRYHTRAVERGQLRKYYRVRELARELPDIRARVRTHAAARVPSRRSVAAAVVRLISESFFRVGGERYADENKTFGITTLGKRHVAIVKEQAYFTYIGKKSVPQRQVVTNRELARLVKRQLASPGARLFRYRDGTRWRNLTARDVNEYLHDILGVPYSAKDFRTWGGPADTPTEARRNVATTMRLVASELGNTPTICRKSYVHPIVVARYLDEGETITLSARYRQAADAYAHSAEERALIRFLDTHFPERRTRTRPPE